MGDERLRELERRSRASGAPEDEAAWLTERVRAGDLARERVALAAWLGDPAALLVVPRAEVERSPWMVPPLRADAFAELGPFPAGVTPGLELVCGLAAFGREACGRGVLALLAGMGDEAAALEAWLACPCDLHAAVSLAEADILEAELEGGQSCTNVQGSVQAVQRALASTTPDAWARRACEALLAYVGAGVGRTLDLRPMRSEVVSWTLGRRDAARARTDARLRRAEAMLDDVASAAQGARLLGRLGPLAGHLEPALERVVASAQDEPTRELALAALARVGGRFTPPTAQRLASYRDRAYLWPLQRDDGLPRW